MTLQSRWNFRDRVWLDGDESIIGIVTAFQFRETRNPIVEVSWMHNGDAKAAWFEEWRLRAVGDAK
jgi:hypothetical protein